MAVLELSLTARPPRFKPKSLRLPPAPCGVAGAGPAVRSRPHPTSPVLWGGTRLGLRRTRSASTPQSPREGPLWALPVLNNGKESTPHPAQEASLAPPPTPSTTSYPLLGHRLWGHEQERGLRDFCEFRLNLERGRIRPAQVHTRIGQW